MYRTLDADKIIATLEKLTLRIEERFPGAGLVKVGRELLDVSREFKSRAATVARPNLLLRAGIAAALIFGAVLLTYVCSIIEVKRDAENLFGVLQGIEASFNTIVLVGAAVLFLTTVESRWKRQQALGDLHVLRSIVHVIDMHQLTKDPSITGAQGTPASPKRQLGPFELARYLDYCSELLSISGKVAALYAQSTKDPIVVETVSDLDQMTANLSGKIWQKISIIERQMRHEQTLGLAPRPAADPIPPRPANTP